MTYLATSRARIQKDIVTRIVRVLNGRGELKVKVGQEVSPDEIIGIATTASGFRIINLASQLSVNPADVGKYLAKNLNQRIYKGELLALKKGGFLGGQKIITAPSDGILDFLNPKTGELRLSFLPAKVNLVSGVYGIVEFVDKERGQVTIKTQVSLIRGVIGSGRLREGILRILGKKDDLIAKTSVETKYSGYIIVGGSLFFKDTISSAISLGINGLISGGINAEDYRSIAGGRLIFPEKFETDIGLSIVVTEGFGAIPVGGDIFNILSSFEGRFVFIDGNKGLVYLPSFSSSSMTIVKKTALPKVSAEESGTGTVELKVGQRVRIIGNYRLGEHGKILAINSSETQLPSGIKAILAIVETEKRKIEVPVANLEVVV